MDVYLLLGSNLGDRRRNISQAEKLINEKISPLVASSSFYETAPWGFSDQPAFLNRAVKIQTHLEPQQLLDKLIAIEKIIGKKKSSRYGPRGIDIDILLFDDHIVNSETLTIPHPRMHLRRFTLVPLAEIAADVTQPVLKKTIRVLLEICDDDLEVTKISENFSHP